MSSVFPYLDTFPLRDYFRRNVCVGFFITPKKENVSKTLGVISENFKPGDTVVKCFSGRVLLDQIKNDSFHSDSSRMSSVPIVIIDRLSSIDAEVIEKIRNHLLNRHKVYFNSLLFVISESGDKLPKVENQQVFKKEGNQFTCFAGHFKDSVFKLEGAENGK